MGDFNKQICRLCLEITPAFECETIEEIRTEILEVLPIKIDFDKSTYAVVCNRCLETLQNCFDFKSQCINTLMDVDLKVDIKKEVFQSEIPSHESISQEGSQVCQLCMSLFEVEASSCTIDWKYMIRNCLPDTDLNAVHEPLICKQCLSSMTRYYEFMTCCQKVEQRIERFCQVTVHGTTGKVNLKDLLIFEDHDVQADSTIIKSECPDVEFVDVNVMKCLKSEEIVNIKCEEVDIKDELDNGVEKGEFNQSEDYNNSGRFSKIRKIRGGVSKRKMNFCPKCPYSSTRADHIKQHMHSHSETELRQCTLCSFVADARFSLKAHMTSHRGPSKAFGCRVCPYETDQKNNLLKHLNKHKDKSQVEMQKCPLCPYQSVYKSTVLRHQKLEHDTNTKMYNCKDCWFSTKHRANFTRHLLLHKDPKDITKFKCEKCEYVSKKWVDLKKHMVIHSDERPFSCNQCTYSTNSRGNLLKHKQIHPDNGVREMFKCNQCNYQAKTGTTLKAHMAKTHKDPSVPNMRCAHCPYQTTVKTHLSRHMRQWHGSGNQPTFKCALCPYTSTEKDNLWKHSFVHQEANLQCDQCDFRTKRKSNLQAHMYLHDPSKQPTFKCDQCEYSTRQKCDLSKHQLKHMGLEEVIIYYCATCDFKSKYKRSLRKHVKNCLKSKSTKESDDNN